LERYAAIARRCSTSYREPRQSKRERERETNQSRKAHVSWSWTRWWVRMPTGAS
jgi:hypothetical protein